MFKRKYEFKPDRTGSGALSKLFVTKKQRLSILKWVLSGILLVAASILQDVVLSRVQLFGTTVNITAALLLMHCIMLDPEVGSTFILSASALYWFSGSAPGVYVIALMTVIGVMAGIIRQGYLYDGFGSVIVCTACSFGLYELVVFGISAFLGLTTADRLPQHLLGAFLSICVLPLFYPVIKAIANIGGNTWND